MKSQPHASKAVLCPMCLQLWTERTWNPWWGCGELAPECGVYGGGEGGYCYAAVFASRNIHPIHAGTVVGGKWTGKITRSGESVWKAPLSVGRIDRLHQY